MFFTQLQLILLAELFCVSLVGVVFFLFISLNKLKKSARQIETQNITIAELTSKVNDTESRAKELEGHFSKQRLVLEKEIANYREQVDNLENFKRLYLEIDAKSRSLTNTAIEMVNKLLSSALESDWEAVAEAGAQLEEELRSINPFLESLDVPEGEIDLSSLKERENDTQELRDLVRKQEDLIASLQDAIKSNSLTANKAADGLTDIERLMVESGRIIEMLGKDLEEARAEIEELKSLQVQESAKAEATVEVVVDADEEVEDAVSGGDSNDPFVNILENRIKTLEKKNKEYEETIDQLDKENQKLKNKLEAAKAHSGGAKEVEGLSQQLGDKEEEIARLKADYEKLEEEYMNLFANASNQ